jgi:uncharacterized repeat protein (TIGR01451 family)
MINSNKNSIKNISLKSLLVGTVASLVFITSQAIAVQAGHLKVTSNVQKMVIVNKDGKKTYEFLPAAKVLPGETVQYNTVFENISNKPADNINIVNPIPKHLVYLPNSAHGKNTKIMFSVDGGKHYGKAGTLIVRGNDGKLYPAKPSDYTHIQWQYLGKLPPKIRQAVGYRARLL